MHKNLFCFIWESNGNSSNKAIEDELKPNFKVTDGVISEKHVKKFNKYEYKPKKVQSQLTNMTVYDLETFNTDKAFPYAMCMYRLGKVSGKYNRDKTPRKFEKCRKDCIVFKGTDSINELLDHNFQFKRKPEGVNYKIVKYN